MMFDNSFDQEGRCWFEKHEMLDIAQTFGFRVTEALLHDWIEKGLIGQAERVWLGRARGSTAKWSLEQFLLFLTLLQERQRERERGKVPIGLLCTIPVWKWVYWGDLGGVSFPQVRRVMGTWAAFVQKIPASKVRKDAHEVVKNIQGARASGKIALLNELIGIGAFDKDAEEDLLRYLLEPVVTSAPKTMSRNDEAALLADLEMLSTMLPLRLKMVRDFEQIAHLPDPVWEWARTFLLYVQFQGQSLQPALASIPRFADRYSRLTARDVCVSSCYDLLALLSVAAQNLFAGGDKNALPFLNPD